MVSKGFSEDGEELLEEELMVGGGPVWFGPERIRRRQSYSSSLARLAMESLLKRSRVPLLLTCARTLSSSIF